MPGFAGFGYEEALRKLEAEREERLGRCRASTQRRHVERWFRLKKKELLHTHF
jgi:hypothetical protein